jgi:hypothetical protein
MNLPADLNALSPEQLRALFTPPFHIPTIESVPSTTVSSFPLTCASVASGLWRWTVIFDRASAISVNLASPLFKRSSVPFRRSWMGSNSPIQKSPEK